MYILSGSQNLSVLKDISESLAGRVAIVNLLPMTRSELTESGSDSLILGWLKGDITNTGPFRQSTSVPVYPLIYRGGYPKIMEFPDHLVTCWRRRENVTLWRIKNADAKGANAGRIEGARPAIGEGFQLSMVSFIR
jgi:predicted AAA+ superfamily ATPase